MRTVTRAGSDIVITTETFSPVKDRLISMASKSRPLNAQIKNVMVWMYKIYSSYFPILPTKFYPSPVLLFNTYLQMICLLLDSILKGIVRCFAYEFFLSIPCFECGSLRSNE